MQRFALWHNIALLLPQTAAHCFLRMRYDFLRTAFFPIFIWRKEIRKGAHRPIGRQRLYF